MIWLIVLVVVLILAALLFYLSWRLFLFTCLRKKDSDEIEGAFAPYREQVKKAQEWIHQHISETLEVISFDGLKLHAALIPAEHAKGVVIAIHGYGSRYNVDFAPQAQYYHEQGYHLILPMQRAHLGSEGKYITFGVKERFDAKLWTHRAVELYGESIDIFLAGISMGASTALMASQLALPGNIRGIISDCGYTSPWEIVKHVAARNLHLPSFPLLYTTNLMAKWFAKFDLRDASALEAMQVNKLPVLFIHGSEDSFVPVYMTEKNYAACRADKYKLLISGAKHAQAYVVDMPAYEKAVSEFLITAADRPIM